MARVAINTGASANDGLGDNLRSAGGILNSNFLELYTYLGAGSTTVLSAPIWSSTNAGINTLRNVGIGTTNPRFALEVGAVGASGTTLFVNGDARVTGIVTIGPASITLNGITNIINVGTGITINGSTGIISATAIVLGGTTLTGAAVTFITAGSGISVNQGTGNVTITATGTGSTSQWVTTAAGIHTLSNVGIGTINPQATLQVVGVVSATSFSGSGANLTGISSVSFATTSFGLSGTPNLNVGVATVTQLGINTTTIPTKLYVQGNAASNIVTLTDGATITPDFTLGNNFQVTIAASRTIANPTGVTTGQSGVIFIQEDGTGGYTVGWGTSWDFASSTAPTLITTASALNALPYFARSTTSIVVGSVISGIGTL